MNTNHTINEMTSHAKRQEELKGVANLFEELSLKVDDYRDGVSRKLDELHMSLQRPKVPFNSATPGLLLPS